MPPRRAAPTGLTLNAEQQLVYDKMRRRGRAYFNNLGDNPSKLAYLQGLIDKRRSDKEKSVCIVKKRYIFVINFH